MIMLKETQELFCETEEQVEELLEAAKNDSRELVGKRVDKKIKKFKNSFGEKREIEWFHVRLTYQNTTINDIIEENYI